MINIVLFLVAACFFLCGMNFTMWLENRSRTRNLAVAVFVGMAGAANLVTLAAKIHNL
jgi:hypothetical protein